MIDSYDDNNDLVLFLKTINCNSIQFELIRFWGWHPRVKLTSDSLACILNIAKSELSVELAALIEKDILAEQHFGLGGTVYSPCHRMQLYSDRLRRLDWSEILRLKKQLFNRV